MRHVLRKSLGLVPFLLSACGSGPEGGPPAPVAGTSAAGALSAGAGGRMVSNAAAAGSSNGSAGGAGKSTPSSVNMSSAGRAAMSGNAGARASLPPARGDDDAGVAASSGMDIPFTSAVSNANINGVEFAMAPASKLDCGMVQIDTSEPVTFTNWCGTQPKPFIQLQALGAEMVVLPLAEFEIPAGNTLLVSGTRALVLLVRGAVKIAGTLDVSAHA